MKAYFTIEVRDRYGKLLRRIRRKSHSYVQQWNEMVCVQVGGKTSFSMKDTGDTDRDVDANVVNFAAYGTEAVATYGIVIGTGDTAVTISDNKLEAQIAQGTGAGQMYHYVCTVADASVSGSDCSFTLTRVIGNQTAATIVVKEIGIYIGGHDGTTTRFFLGVRDVLASSISVPAGGAITVVYTIKVSV